MPLYTLQPFLSTMFKWTTCSERNSKSLNYQPVVKEMLKR